MISALVSLLDCLAPRQLLKDFVNPPNPIPSYDIKNYVEKYDTAPIIRIIIFCVL